MLYREVRSKSLECSRKEDADHKACDNNMSAIRSMRRVVHYPSLFGVTPIVSMDTTYKYNNSHDIYI